MNYRSRPSTSGVLCTPPPAWVGEAQCGAKEAKIYICIIPIVYLLSRAVYLRNGADRDGWDPYLIIRPKWRVNGILTRWKFEKIRRARGV